MRSQSASNTAAVARRIRGSAPLQDYLPANTIGLIVYSAHAGKAAELGLPGFAEALAGPTGLDQRKSEVCAECNRTH